MLYVNCSTYNQVNYNYTLKETINLIIPACEGNLGTITGTLNPIGTPSPPDGFAVLTKSIDDSWLITI